MLKQILKCSCVFAALVLVFSAIGALVDTDGNAATNQTLLGDIDMGVGTLGDLTAYVTNVVDKSSITDGTNMIDAAGNVWEVRIVYSDAWNLTTVIGFNEEDVYNYWTWPYWDNDGWYIDKADGGDVYRLSTNESAIVLLYEEGANKAIWDRGVSGVITNYVGKLALTNDIDYTTNNTQLVATIEATAPAPGNYLSVSNSAMNARGATDLGVRGVPLGEGSWFKVKMTALKEGDSSQDLTMVWDSSSGSWVDNLEIYKTEEGYGITDGGFDIYFTLDENFSSVFTDEEGDYHYSVVGYTNKLALTSDIPLVVSPSTNAVSGTAADAKATGTALYTGFTEWEFSGVPSRWEITDITYELGDWGLYYSVEGEPDAISTQGAEDALTLTFAYSSEIHITATRHLVTPTRTSQLENDGPKDGLNVGHPFATTNQIPDITSLSNRIVELENKLSGIHIISTNKYDFSTNVGLYTGVRDIIVAFGGTVTNFPAIPSGGN